MPRDPLSKILSLSDLLKVREQLRRAGSKVATTNGCFDILHWGHIRYLHDARKLADCLIVLVNEDASVKQLKGPKRPVQDASARSRQVAGIEAVDYVCLFSENTPETALEKLQPDIHCKGGDYRPEDLPESRVVQASGGRVVCLPLQAGFSTSALIERLLESES